MARAIGQARAVFEVLFLALLVGAAACGGGENGPAGPSGSSTSSPATCRVYASRYSIASSLAAGVVEWTCNYDTSTNRLTCTSQVPNGVDTGVISYRSRADFVSETFDLRRMTEIITTPAGGSPLTQTMSYDAQGRLTRQEDVYQGSIMGTTIVTAWDNSGRPTAVTVSSPSGRSTQFQYVYNDGARTVRQLSTDGSGSYVEWTYDANGSQLGLSSYSGTTVTTFTTTVLATQQVCT